MGVCVFQGISNAYEIVDLKRLENYNQPVAEPYLIPNVIAMEYETPVDRDYEEPPDESSK